MNDQRRDSRMLLPSEGSRAMGCSGPNEGIQGSLLNQHINTLHIASHLPSRHYSGHFVPSGQHVNLTINHTQFPRQI